MAEWKEKKLGDLLRIKHGYAFAGEHIVTDDNGKVLVTPGNFAIGGGWKPSYKKFYSGDFPEEYILSEGDVVVTMTDLSKDVDTLGFSAKVPKDSRRTFLHNQRIGLVRDVSDDAEPDFLHWVMRTAEYRASIVGTASGSTVSHTAPSRIYEYKFDCPEPEEQRAIASVLSSLDAKIDLLHRQNKTLEAMAETLFRQWFLEGDGIPVPVTDYIDFNPTVRLRKGQSAPYLEMRNLQETSSIPDGIRYREFTSGMRFQNGDTLLARISPCLENGKCCYVQCMNEGEVGWGSTEFIVMRSKKGYSPFLTYALAKSSDFIDFAANTLAGSSGRQRAQLNIVMEFQLVKPDANTVSTINAQFEGFAKRIDLNHRQITSLTALRDTLLPKLMSGEVRVEGMAP